MLNNLTTSIVSIPDPAWQTLAEFTLPSQPGYDHQARIRVVEVVRQLNLPVDCLERLKAAVTEATLNAIEHDHRYQAHLPVLIRALVLDQTLLACVPDQGCGGPQPKTERPGLSGQQLSRGWGFFLIKRMMDGVRITGAEAHHTIELFLYLEGEI